MKNLLQLEGDGMKELADILKEKNLKVTPQRLAVYSVLYHSIEHPTAEFIFYALRETHPTMSLATVYKTLDTLTTSGLIQSINVGEDSFRYDAIAAPHPHFICLTCHKVSDFEDIALNEHIQSNSKYDILYEKRYFYGYCEECKKDL